MQGSGGDEFDLTIDFSSPDFFFKICLLIKL